MITNGLPVAVRRRVKRAARKLSRSQRTCKRELRTMAEHHPRFRPNTWRPEVV